MCSCSNGWRLEAWRRIAGGKCAGLDPSAEAIAAGRQLFPKLDLQTGTADHLPFARDSFDLRNVYRHRPGVYSYKMDYAALFAWNPAYTLISRSVFGAEGAAIDDPDARISVSVLRKDTRQAYPETPFRVSDGSRAEK